MAHILNFAIIFICFAQVQNISNPGNTLLRILSSSPKYSNSQVYDISHLEPLWPENGYDGTDFSVDTKVNKLGQKRFYLYSTKAKYNMQYALIWNRLPNIIVDYPPLDIFSYIMLMKNVNRAASTFEIDSQRTINDYLFSMQKGRSDQYIKCLFQLTLECYLVACAWCSGTHFLLAMGRNAMISTQDNFCYDNGVGSQYSFMICSSLKDYDQRTGAFQNLQLQFLQDWQKQRGKNLSFSQIFDWLVAMNNFDQLEKELAYSSDCQSSSCLACSDSDLSLCFACIDSFNLLDGQCQPIKPEKCENVEVKQPYNQILCTKCMTGYFMQDNAPCRNTTLPTNYYCNSEYTHCCKLGNGSIIASEKDTYMLKCASCKDVNCIKCGGSGGLGACSQCGPGYTLDGAQNCVKCPQELCVGCSGTDPQQCTACVTGFKLMETAFKSGVGSCTYCTKGTCSTQVLCQKGQYRNKEPPFLCMSCSQYCQRCYSNKSCEKCINGSSLDEKGNCQPNYDSFYYDGNEDALKRCNFACSKCLDDGQLCTLCSKQFPYFVVIDDQKVRCFSVCPQGYISDPQNDPNADQKRCIFNKSQQQISQEKVDQSLHLQRPSKCASWYCLFCPNDTGCLKCMAGYYYDTQWNQCMPCHALCSTCTGPAISDCLSCTATQEQPLGSSTVTECSKQSSQANRNYCNSTYTQIQDGYASGMEQIYYQYDELKDFDIWLRIDANSIDQYPSIQQYQFKSGNLGCLNVFTTISNQSQDLISIFTAIIMQQIMLLNLNSQMDTNQLFSLYKERNQTRVNCSPLPLLSTFSTEAGCPSYTCQTILEKDEIKFNIDDNTTLGISRTKYIPFEKGMKSCSEIILQDTSSYDSEAVNDLENLMNYYKSSQNTDNFIFIMNLCVIDESSRRPYRTAVLLKKQLGSGFYQFLRPNKRQYNYQLTLYAFGATREQNIVLYKCYPGYRSPFDAYKILSAVVYEISSNDYINLLDSTKLKIEQNEKSLQNSPKCQCVKVNEFIKLNDNQGGFLSDCQSQDCKTVLTPFIKTADLQKLGINTQNILTDFLYKQGYREFIFNLYIDSMIIKVRVCYPLVSFDQLPQCVQNILVDVAYSNQGKCLKDEELSKILKTGTFTYELITKAIYSYLINTDWCLLNQERCKRNQRILQQCF